jgi:enoyl-CoA hydratase/carnithine racemase
MNDGSQLIYTVEGAVALLTLNRPDKRNALNDVLIGELRDALRQADANDSVRVIVITGAGADFCSGADLSALQKISESSITENLADAQTLADLFALMRRVRVPIVACRARARSGGRLRAGDGLRPRRRRALRPLRLPGSEDWFCARDGDGDPASQRLRETRL